MSTSNHAYLYLSVNNALTNFQYVSFDHWELILLLFAFWHWLSQFFKVIYIHLHCGIKYFFRKSFASIIDVEMSLRKWNFSRRLFHIRLTNIELTGRVLPQSCKAFVWLDLDMTSHFSAVTCHIAQYSVSCDGNIKNVCFVRLRDLFILNH